MLIFLIGGLIVNQVYNLCFKSTYFFLMVFNKWVTLKNKYSLYRFLIFLNKYSCQKCYHKHRLTWFISSHQKPIFIKAKTREMFWWVTGSDTSSLWQPVLERRLHFGCTLYWFGSPGLVGPCCLPCCGLTGAHSVLLNNAGESPLHILPGEASDILYDFIQLSK